MNENIPGISLEAINLESYIVSELMVSNFENINWVELQGKNNQQKNPDNK